MSLRAWGSGLLLFFLSLQLELVCFLTLLCLWMTQMLRDLWCEGEGRDGKQEAELWPQLCWGPWHILCPL